MPEQYGFSIRGGVALFFATLEELLGKGWFDRVSFYVESQQKTEFYRWLGMVPQMREWLDGRNPQGLRKDAYNLDNLKFEATLDFERDDLIRGLSAQIQTRIQELADRANQHWEFLATGAISIGDSALCYDGEPFFSAIHPKTDKNPAWKNLLTAADVAYLNVAVAAAPNAMEMAQAVMGVIGYMLGVKDDQGLPMNSSAKRFQVHVPVPLWMASVGPALINVASGASAMADNPLSKMAEALKVEIEVVPNPLLTWTVDFAVFRTDGRAKPFIKQEEYQPIVSIKGPGSEYEHDTDRNQFGLKASRNVGYGYPQYAARATLSHA